MKLLHPADLPQPMQACLAVQCWLLVMSVVVLPLCILCTLERRARQRFWEEAARAAREAAAAASSLSAAVAARAAAAAASGEAPGQLVPTFPLTGLWPLDAYIYSGLVWALADMAMSWL